MVAGLFYGDLVEAASKLELPKQTKIKDEAQFTIVGTGVGHWDAPQIVSGKAIFGLDVRLPGMSFAAIARCPVFGGTFASYDDSAAKAIPGVQQVVPLDDAIAVVAENTWAAIRGRDALEITWDEGRNASLNSEELRNTPRRFSSGGTPYGCCLEIPFKRTTMEPMNCTKHVHDGMCEVWAPTRTAGCAATVASAGIPLGCNCQCPTDRRRVWPPPGDRLCCRSGIGLTGDQRASASGVDAR
jgi:isoquinoline 1-oxidoreductase beta subunit